MAVWVLFCLWIVVVELERKGVVPQPEFWSGFPWAHACWHESASEESLQQPNLQLRPVPECEASKNLQYLLLLSMRMKPSGMLFMKEG